MNILFLCTGNSCRSQMAEGWTTHLKGDVLAAYSAGIATHGLNPHAITVMDEVGIDISGNTSKLVTALPDGIEFDYVITVCDHAHENCPYFPAKVKVAHVGFDDPPSLTKGMENKNDILAVYRRVRDEIKNFVETLPGSLDE